MYKHVLITTDGSELAEKGLDHGLAIAKGLGAQVTVVTVTESWSPFEIVSDIQHGRTNALEEFQNAAATTAGKILAKAEEKAKALGVAIKTLHVPDMHPAEGIVDAAKKNGCDVIVIASHGRRGASRLLLGSQTSEVLASTNLPVLVIR